VFAMSFGCSGGTASAKLRWLPERKVMTNSETFTYGTWPKQTLEVSADGIKDGDHFIPFGQIMSVNKSGGKWWGYDLEIVWGRKGLWASDHSSGHKFGFREDVESRDRAYELIVSRLDKS
jgi:hypothetical protein